MKTDILLIAFNGGVLALKLSDFDKLTMNGLTDSFMIYDSFVFL